MRIQELFETELPVKELSYTDPGINQHLTSLGYKTKPGMKGKDQTTWIAPDGSIYKIFGTKQGQKGFSEDQRMFATWVKYTEDHNTNPYMPHFSEWHSFEYPPDSDQKYLQIKMEKLIPVTDPILKNVLEQFDQFVENGHDFNYLKQLAKMNLRDNFKRPDVQKLFQDKLLWNTVVDLNNIAASRSWRLDLHSRNYMLRGDQVVIVDPWVASS